MIPLALEIAVKAITYASLLAVTGAASVHWLMVRRVDRASPVAKLLDRDVLAIAGSAALIVNAALLCRAWTHTAAAFGVADAFSWANLQLIVTESRWGRGWRVQIAVAVIVFAATRWARRARHAGWWAITIASVALCYAVPLVGHAAGDRWRLVLHGTHLLGASTWLGTLSVLFLIGRRDDGERSARSAVALSLLRGFASTAFVGAALAAVTGTIAAAIYLQSIAALWTVAYGQALITKLLLVAGAATCGYVNWRSLQARPGDGGRHDAAGDMRTPAPVVWLEAAFAIAVIAATAVLTELEHP